MNQINWEALSEEELYELDQLPIRRVPSGISFTAELSWEDISKVFRHIFAIYKRTPNPDDNHIGFALGDCLKEMERLHGADRTQKFVLEYQELIELRDKILEMMGACLIQIQAVEHVIQVCCSIFELKGMKFSLSGLMSGDKKVRTATLGQMKNAFKAKEVFSPDFESEFESYVESRNEFIHHLWVRESVQHVSEFVPNRDSIKRIGEYTWNLMMQSTRISRIFQGMLEYALSQMPENVRKQVVPQNAIFLRLRLVPEFEAVRRRIEAA